MSDAVHWWSTLGATHAVPDVMAAHYTADPDRVTCPVCLSHIEGE